MKLIAIIGKKRSGKDTLADFVNDNYESVKHQLAEPIKKVLYQAYGKTLQGSKHIQALSFDDWEGCGTYDREKALLINNVEAEKVFYEALEICHNRYKLVFDYENRVKNYIENNVLNNTEIWTMRRFMQTLGTDIIVKLLDRMFWVKLFANEYLDKFGQDTPPDYFIVPDVRQTFEIDALRAMGATIVHVVRPSNEDENEDSHITEAGLPIHESDTVIINDGSLEQLYEKIKKVL